MAIFACTVSSSPTLASTKIASQPNPLSKSAISSSVFLAKMVGFEILPPLICKIGSTAPSFTGLIKLDAYHPAINGPVSASPSPITVAAITEGLSKIAPTACEIEYPSSPPSWIDPGVSGAA